MITYGVIPCALRGVILEDKMQRVYLYYAEVCSGECAHQLYPNERMEEINGCKNEGVRREKYSAWALLRYAITDALALKFEDVQFVKLPSGQWICDKCSFSISHADGAVVVAVSDLAVGADVEIVKSINPRLAPKILTDLEFARYSELSDFEKTGFLLERWCKKEAIFKANGGSVLLPGTIECDDYYTAAERISINGHEFAVAIAANEDFKVEIRSAQNIN